MEFKSKWGSLVTVFRPTESDNDDNNLKRSIWMLGSVLWSRKVFSSAESRASWGRSHRSEVWWMGNNIYWFWLIPFTWTWLEVHQYSRHNSTLKLSKNMSTGLRSILWAFCQVTQLLTFQVRRHEISLSSCTDWSLRWDSKMSKINPNNDNDNNNNNNNNNDDDDDQ